MTVVTKGLVELSELNGTAGTISAALAGGLFQVTLQSGDVLDFLEASNLGRPEPACIRSGLASYVPLAAVASSSLKSQAGTLLQKLESLKAQASVDPIWHARFWVEVSLVQDLSPALRALFEGHGYIGPKTVTPPRADALTGELRSLSLVGAPAHGTAAALWDDDSAEPVPADITAEGIENALNFKQWHSRLAGDFSRAAPDIYRKIRSNGASSVRSYVTDFFPIDQRSGPLFQSKFEQASQIDFRVAECGSQSQLMEMLSTDDVLEVSLRSLAAWIHLRRTGDSEAANHMLAVRGPGSGADIAPTWLVTESGVQSTQEFNRHQHRKGAGKALSKNGDSEKPGAKQAAKAKTKETE